MGPEPKIQATRWTVEREVEAVAELSGSDHAFNPARPGPVFSIDTPPPYPSGSWHIGAAAGYSLIDMVARSRRMLGFNVLFPWGLDRNGINIELVVEKKHKKRIHEWSREEFIALCEKEIEVHSGKLEETARRLAISADFANRYLTDSPEYRAFTQAVFIELWHKGLVDEQLRPNNFCPVCGTTIGDAEVLREARQATLAHMRWDVVGPVGGSIRISTTRPELLCAARVVLVHPDDERYRSMHGRKVRVPIYNHEVEVRPHPTADPGYGSGAMMVCSYGDSNDVQIFRELQLEPVAAINERGQMTAAAGPLEGQYVKKAREEAIRLLEEGGHLEGKQTVEQTFPICERSASPVEIIALKEWYVKQVEWLDDMRAAAAAMAFHPDRHRQLLLDWVNSVTIDWPVSRRRYYHTEIPLWYCTSCRTPAVPPPGKYYRPWKDSAPFDACASCGGSKFEGEDRVFDTWMDSSNSAIFILKRYGEEFFKKCYPCSIRPQGRDIVRTWLHYTTLRGLQLTGKPPFEHVLIHGMGMDERGQKMSKSRGNVIAPDAVLSKFGSDAFRLQAASESRVGDDFRVSEERIQGAQKFLTKLHNVARFISSFPAPSHAPDRLHPTDGWIMGEVDALVDETRRAYEGFSFFDAATAIRSFVWNVFAPHYLELAKGRAYAGEVSAAWTLHTSLRAVLRLLAPIAPVLPWAVWRELYGGDIHKEQLPEPLGVVRRAEVGERIVEFNSQLWKLKKERGLAFADALTGVEIPQDLAEFADDFKAMHKLAS
jgi:valyl-tRNA synthetase